MRNGTMAVLVAERDGEWGGWVDQLRTTASAVRVIAQRPSESASAFASRVRSEAQRLDVLVGDAVLVGGPVCDPETLAARALIVRALTSKMPADARLHLDGAGRARFAMEALAQIVSDQLHASGVEVVTERAPAVAPAPSVAPIAPAPLPLAA